MGCSMRRLVLKSWVVAAVLAATGAAFAQQASQQVFRITAIPDESPTELARKAQPLIKYLEAKLGMKVEYTPVTDMFNAPASTLPAATAAMVASCAPEKATRFKSLSGSTLASSKKLRGMR